MEFRTLKAFAAVVQEGGFSPAAKAVFATQSTISKAVKHLEDELGTPLLERLGARSELTDAGRVVYRRALTMLAERDDLLAELDEMRELKRGALRLGISPLGASLIYAPLFARYCALYPGVELQLVEQGARVLESQLIEGRLDLAISLLPGPPPFEEQEILAESLLVMLRADHPLAAQPTIGLADLAKEPFILYPEEFRLNDVILAACARAGFNPTIAVRSSQADFIVELVALRLGVGFIPRAMADECRHADVAYREIDGPGLSWRVGFIWRRNAYLSTAARAWLRLARETPYQPEAGEAAAGARAS